MNGIIVGVDGGGTKTKLVAVDVATGKTSATATVGGINACTLGVTGAAKNLLEGIEALGLRRTDNVLAVAIGDPAIDDSSPMQGYELRKALAESGLLQDGTRYFSCSDVCMALYAYTRGNCGALIVAGTGSMGVAFDKPYKHGEINTPLVVGGWGEPTRDNGSGFYIAVKGIEAAMDSFDGVAKETALCKAATEFFGVGSARDLIGVFNGDGLKKSEIAAFARRVDYCAKNGDKVAAEILDRAGCLLGRYAVSLLDRMPKDGRRAGMYGSVLVGNELVRSSFIKTVASAYPDAKTEIPDNPPEIGAAYYAADALGLNLGK